MLCLLPPVASLRRRAWARAWRLLDLLASFAADIIYLVRTGVRSAASGAVARDSGSGHTAFHTGTGVIRQMCSRRSLEQHRKVLEETELEPVQPCQMSRPDMVAVDRATGELRRGGMVIIDDDHGAVLAQAAETVTAQSLAALVAPFRRHCEPGADRAASKRAQARWSGRRHRDAPDRRP